MDEDLVPREFVARTMARHLRLPMGWDDAERQKLIDEAAEQVAARVAELADDWADRAVTEWGRQHWRLPDSETQARLVREARTSALVMVLCDVLPDVPVAESCTRWPDTSEDERDHRRRVASVAAAYAGADEEKLNAYRAETAVSEADMRAELAAADADFAAGNTASGDEVRRRYGLS